MDTRQRDNGLLGPYVGPHLQLILEQKKVFFCILRTQISWFYPEGCKTGFFPKMTDQVNTLHRGEWRCRERVTMGKGSQQPSLEYKPGLQEFWQ